MNSKSASNPTQPARPHSGAAAIFEDIRERIADLWLLDEPEDKKLEYLEALRNILNIQYLYEERREV